MALCECHDRVALEATVDRRGSIEEGDSCDDDFTARFGSDNRVATDLEVSFDAPQPGDFAAANRIVFHERYLALRAFLASKVPSAAKKSKKTKRPIRSPANADN